LVRTQQPTPPLWAFAPERESETKLYVRPAPPAVFPSGTGTLQRVTMGVRANAVAIGFVATCIALGVAAGTVIAVRGGNSKASHATTPTTSSAPSVEPIVEPPTNVRPIVKPLPDTNAAVANRLVR
jgi:hypothetical protein